MFYNINCVIDVPRELNMYDRYTIEDLVTDELCHILQSPRRFMTTKLTPEEMYEMIDKSNVEKVTVTASEVKE